MSEKAEKQPKPPRWAWLSDALAAVPWKIVMPGLVAALGLSGGWVGKTFADAGGARVDSLEARVDTLEVGLESIQANQLEMYSAQIEADTTLKRVLEARALNRRKAAEARAETAKLLKDLTGGSP